jgi:hypothetical protein
MKRISLLWLCLSVVGVVWAADDLAPRRDIYGPAVSQWKWATVSSNSVIKSGAGVLGCVVVSSATSSVWSIRDAASATGSVVISTFPASAQVGTYCYNIETNNGITAVIPASGNVSVTVTYR